MTTSTDHNKRIIHDNYNDFSVYTIYAQKVLSVLILRCIILCVSIFLMAFLLNMAFNNLTLKLILIIMALIGLSIGLRALYLIIWTYIGKETIAIYPNKLLIEKNGIIPTRREYDASYIKDMRAEQDVDNWLYYSAGLISILLDSDNKQIRFNYNEKTVCFGQGLEPDDVIAIINQIKARFKQKYIY